MAFQLQADGQFPDDADGSQQLAFSQQVQTLFATLTTAQLNNFSMNVSQPVIVVPIDPATGLPVGPAMPPIKVTPPVQQNLT